MYIDLTRKKVKLTYNYESCFYPRIYETCNRTRKANAMTYLTVYVTSILGFVDNQGYVGSSLNIVAGDNLCSF